MIYPFMLNKACIMHQFYRNKYTIKTLSQTVKLVVIVEEAMQIKRTVLFSDGLMTAYAYNEVINLEVDKYS